jgi:hypothetical protein
MTARRRYSIWGQQHGSDHEVEILQVDSNPQAALDGLCNKMLKDKPVRKGGKANKVRQYSWLRIVENIDE